MWKMHKQASWRFSCCWKASLTSCLCTWLLYDIWEVSSSDLDCRVAQLLGDSPLGWSGALWDQFGRACGRDAVDLLWLVQSCSSVCCKCRGACVGDVQTGPSWSGRKISPERGFAVHLRSLGRAGHVSLPSAVEGGILFWQINVNADSSACAFSFPRCCG